MKRTYHQETPWCKKKKKNPCKAEAWFIFATMQMCMLLISRQRAESSKPGSIGGSRRSIFTNVCLPRSFSAWEDFRVVVRSLLHVPAARGNSLQLRINHSDAPRRLVEKGGASVRTTRTESRLWSHFEVERNSQRQIIQQLLLLFHFLPIGSHPVGIFIEQHFRSASYWSIASPAIIKSQALLVPTWTSMGPTWLSTSICGFPLFLFLFACY